MQFPLSMADFQLLGDGFGYHPGYAPTGNPSNTNPGGPNLDQQATWPNNAAMAAMMSSSAIGGSSGYGMMPPHGTRAHGLPQRSLPPFGAPLSMPGSVQLGSRGDASKMHDQYASSGFHGAASQSTMRSGHYSHDSRYGHSHSCGYPGVPMGSGPGGPPSLGAMSQHNGGLVPQANLTSHLPGSSSYQTRGMLSGYSDQRMLSPILGPGSGNPYPGPYPSSYGPTPSGTSTRLWPNQGISHVQQRPPYGYNTGSVVPPQTSAPRSGQPSTSSPFGPNASDYGSLHSQQPTKQSHQTPSQSTQQQQQQSQSQAQLTRPYYGASGRAAPPSSSPTIFIPSEPTPPMSPYLSSSYSSNTSPYPPKVPSGSNTPSSWSISSCMVAAAAAAAALTSNSNASANYLQHNLTPTGSGDSETYLYSDKMDDSQLNLNVDSVISDEPTLNSVFNGLEIELPNLNFPLIEASAAANYAQQMRIDGKGPKKIKERSKKHKKKEKSKNIDRISMPTNPNSNLNYLSLFPYPQPNSHYHESFSNHMNQSCHNFQQSHHQSPAHPSTPVHQQTTIYAKSSNTPYTEPSSAVNQQLNQQQQQQQQVPQSQASAISQTIQPAGVSSSLSEPQPSHLQSQPNLMPQSELVPRVSPSCFDTSTALSDFQSELLNGALGEQLHNSGSRHSNHSNHSAHSNHTNSSIDYLKSHSDNTSQQPLIVHHNPDNQCAGASSSNIGTSDNNNRIDNNQIPEKFPSIEDELDFLTATEECEQTSQVGRNEIGTQVGPQIVNQNSSQDIPMDQQSHQSQHQNQNQHQHQHQLQSHHHQQSQPTQQQVALSLSAVSSTHTTITTATTVTSSLPIASCMEQSKLSSAISLCSVDPLLPNTCAISEDQMTIKSTTTTATSSKGYQTDFIPTNQPRISTPMTVDLGIDVNNVENKLDNNNEGVGLVKKKKKSKEGKSKVFCQQKLIQGQSSPCNEKKVNSSINIVPVHHHENYNKISSHLNNNKSLLSHVTTCKPIEVTNVRKSSDMKDHEAKFFKMRPVANTTITTIHKSGMKINNKGTKKRKIEETKEHKSAVDEYEFPDSPTHSLSTKKVKKVNLENSKKKISDKLISGNNCSITINKKISIKPKMKLNQNFTGNTASTKLNISDQKTEIINIVGPRPTNVNQQLQYNKIKIEEKVVKPCGPFDKKHQPFNTNNNFNSHPTHHQTQRLNKDSSKVPSIIVQEIVAPTDSSTSSLSQPSSTKNLNNMINIVSISKKSSIIGSNQSKKESPPRTCILNNPIPTNTLTTIVPIPASTLNTSIIISNSSTSPNLTTAAITQQPHILLSQSTATTTTTPTPSSATSLSSLTSSSQQLNQSSHSESVKNSTNNQNVLMQSAGTNTPRRRSQDKKALTIREGLMRTGDFVVSLDETESELPMIWRIEGKSLLQRFEPSEQDGQIVYTNTSSYSAWNPTVKQRYTGVDVRIVGCNRTKIVVEKLGLTRNNTNYDKLDLEKNLTGGLNVITNGEITVEKCKAPDDKPPNYFQHQADFEVFIQTLISQALDANFISEIIKENDEYFLSHIQAIDDYCIKKKSRFFTKVKWDAHIVKCVETFSSFNVIPQSQVGDLRCRLCHDKWSTQILHFTGKTYDQVTLETKEPVDIKQTKYAACDECKEKVALFSALHHQKYNFFTNCREKVEEMRGGVEDKDSPMILEECLKDTEWMQSLFKQFEEIWQSCDRIR